MLKKRKRNISVPAHIVSANANELIVELELDKTKIVSANANELIVGQEIDKIKYKRGQMVVATVSTKEKNIGGKPFIVSDVVAQGTIAEVSGKRVTISSNGNNPIVSRRAATEAKKHAAKVSVRVVQ